MQFPDPSEEVQRRASQPLYEFPANGPSQSISPPASERTAADDETTVRAGELREEKSAVPVHAESERLPQPSEEEIRQGLVYPPPPSFYRSAQFPPQPPPFPHPFNNQLPPPIAPGYTPDAVAMQAPPLLPPEIQPPVKRSRTWIWIVVAILAAALLASCGLCGWVSYSMFSSTFKQVAGSMNVVEDYYAAIEAKNYSAAYSFLEPQGTISGLTQDQFTRQARSLDNQYGPVLSYTPATPSFASSSTGGADFSHFTITINIKRPKMSYTALLTLRKIGGTWKIVDFDRI